MAAMKAPGFLMVLASTLPMAARAHHAVGAFFDTSVPMVVDGIVTSARGSARPLSPHLENR